MGFKQVVIWDDKLVAELKAWWKANFTYEEIAFRMQIPQASVKRKGFDLGLHENRHASEEAIRKTAKMRADAKAKSQIRNATDRLQVRR